MNKIISVENLKKVYYINLEYNNLIKRLLNKNKKEVLALDDINLSVERGSIVSLLGKNGAGKTTLVKILSGIITPTSGNVSILGYDPYKERYSYSFHIGVVLGQKSLLWHNIPVIESLNLYKNIYEITESKFKKRLQQFNNIFELDKLLNIPVRKLSLGQRMKCELVASLLHDPEVLFLDEPTIGLDVLSKEQIYEFLKLINHELNTTIILTTHNLNDVEKLCQHVLMIDKGKIIYDGSKNELMKHNTNKTIKVTGSLILNDNLKKHLIKHENDNYIFNCDKENVQSFAKMLSSLSNVYDVDIIGSNLEDIVSKIYKGEIKL